jgi:excinuclease ABC subunit C
VKDKLKEKAESLPKKPGVYLFKNGRGKIIYIGKARLLNERVKSYFQPSDDLKVQNILAETDDIDYILTDSEREAAFLENNLVQQHQPKFNLRLKDDKSFPYLKVTVRERFPRIAFSRKVENDGARYFGPFSPASDARRALHLVGRFFRVRNCDEAIPGKRKRPCLEYDLELCSAPCTGEIGENDYREGVAGALLFLEGKTPQLTKILTEKMNAAVRTQDFEEAARWRDILRALDQIKIKPKMISVRLEDEDIFGYARQGPNQAVYVFRMRQGKVRESREYLFEEEANRPGAEILSEFIMAYYRKSDIPGRILVSMVPSDKSGLEQVLAEKAKRKVVVALPIRGKNKLLIILAGRNAERLLEQKGEDLPELREIQEILRLPALPSRIEGFDVSNTGATETVASLVVFKNGRPNKNEYRKYKIKTVAGPNDVASLEEVIKRRYSRVMREGGPLPDLVLVDGGKPQLKAASKSLVELGLKKIPLVSLAKKKEIVFVPDRQEGLKLEGTSPALKLFQHVRDEAHRFAVKFHRQRRSRRSFE